MPSPNPARTALTTSLSLAMRIVAMPNAAESFECPSCSGPLNLLQPDENDPGRLLGTCESCSTWSLMVEIEPDWRTVVVIDLPDGEEILRGLPGMGEQSDDPTDLGREEPAEGQ